MTNWQRKCVRVAKAPPSKVPEYYFESTRIDQDWRLEAPVNQSQEQVVFRAELWKKFVAEYQTVLVIAPETFSEYCSKFRERWTAGK